MSIVDIAAIAKMDDLDIRRILRKVAALVGADRKTKEAVYRNLSDRVKACVQPMVARLEKGGARDLLIERSRNVMCEALMEVVRE